MSLHGQVSIGLVLSVEKANTQERETQRCGTGNGRSTATFIDDGQGQLCMQQFSNSNRVSGKATGALHLELHLRFPRIFGNNRSHNQQEEQTPAGTATKQRRRQQFQHKWSAAAKLQSARLDRRQTHRRWMHPVAAHHTSDVAVRIVDGIPLLKTHDGAPTILWCVADELHLVPKSGTAARRFGSIAAQREKAGGSLRPRRQPRYHHQ